MKARNLWEEALASLERIRQLEMRVHTAERRQHVKPRPPRHPMRQMRR